MNKEQLAARLLTTFLGELDEQVRVMNADLLALEAAPTDAERLKSLFRVAHTLKGAARSAGVPLIEQACHHLETRLAQARDGKLTLTQSDFPLLFHSADALSEAGQRIRSGRSLDGSSIASVANLLKDTGERRSTTRAIVRPEPPAPTPAPQPSPERGSDQVRVEAVKLDALLAASAQLMVARDRLAAQREAFEALHQFADRLVTEWTRTDHRTRLALERFGVSPALLHAVGGMRENLRRLSSESGRLAATVAADERNLNQATDEVVIRVRQLRMRPFAEACEALPRVTRDIATAAGKEVDLEVQGGATEVDRSVLDGLREALTHLTRNAIDHGIEPPEKRAAAGKSRRGVVTLTATLYRDRLTVTVSDDGAGLDLEAIRTQLRQRSTPIPEDAGELARAIFQGGLSTRGEATAVSGRGVGLDVVRTAVQRIRGTVDVSSVPGRGTTFTIECPPTLAAIRVLLATLGSQPVAIPILSVERLLRIGPEAVRRAEGRDVILTDETPVPLVALARLLPPLVDRPPAGPLTVILLRAADGRRLGVVVDELLGEQEVVLRPLKSGSRQLPHVGGAAILGMGRVALVLNPGSIVAAGLESGGESGAAVGLGQGPTRGRKRLLLVDDSITTRALEQSILESAGYDVITAVDGADGFRLLQEQGCDLVVSDIEMPRMDGFALCQAIRANKRFKELPIVLVTALETAEHRARGLEVGANAYIGKSSFDQTNLLETLHQLVG